MTKFKEELEADVILDNGLKNQEQYFLDILFDECKGNVREAMSRAGYPKATPSSEVTKKFSKEIKDRAREYLAASTARAVISLVDVIEDPNVPGTKNIIAAAKEILDRGGVNKEETVNVNQEQTMFILPAKESDE